MHNCTCLRSSRFNLKVSATKLNVPFCFPSPSFDVSQIWSNVYIYALIWIDHCCLVLFMNNCLCPIYKSYIEVPVYTNVPYINSTAFPTTSYPWHTIISRHTFFLEMHHRFCPCFLSMPNMHCLSMFHNFGYALVCIAVLCCAMCLPHIYTSSWAAWPLVSDQCILPVSLIDLFLAVKAQQALGRNRYHTTTHGLNICLKL